MREARKLKLMKRLGRNQSKPLSLETAEALTGTLRNKKPTALVAHSIQDAPLPPKAEVPKRPAAVKSSLSFRQTATSEKRANLATAKGALQKNPLPPKTQPVAVKRPATAPVPAHARLQKQKLTIPQSPNFSTRRVPTRTATRPATAPLSIKSHMVAARTTTFKQPAKPIVAPLGKKKAPTSTDKVDGEPVITRKRNSASWTVPLSPKRAEPVKATPVLSTPKVKPFVRKSMSESTAVRSVAARQIAGPVNSNVKAQSISMRQSVAPSRSTSFRINKEPSQE